MDHANRHPRRCRTRHSCRKASSIWRCASSAYAHPWGMNIVFDVVQTVVLLIVVSIVNFAVEAGRRHYLSDAASVSYALLTANTNGGHRGEAARGGVRWGRLTFWTFRRWRWLCRLLRFSVECCRPLHVTGSFVIFIMSYPCIHLFLFTVCILMPFYFLCCHLSFPSSALSITVFFSWYDTVLFTRAN
ncbi:hypothetical protein EDD85DRAFT_148812 [Armillaria nabsnona]|nr:hypothetical protein EDD85DRAFT_148812 [Armillaria nabsnona]